MDRGDSFSTSILTMTFNDNLLAFHETPFFTETVFIYISIFKWRPSFFTLLSKYFFKLLLLENFVPGATKNLADLQNVQPNADLQMSK